jgi:hypothetical protein
MSNYKDHPFYTHQPFFIEILKNTTGNILECGCGEGSTIMIKEQIKNTNRQLVSLESNLEWLNKYTHLSDDSHKLYHVDANNDDTLQTGNVWVDFIQKKQLNDFEIVFLDSSPWLSRKCCFDYFLNKAKVIIFHDFDYFPRNNIIGKVVNIETNGHNIKYDCDLGGVVKNYKLFYPPYKYFAGPTGPPTLVCSNIMDDDEFKTLIFNVENIINSYYD